jgi:hypothetical protein
MKYKNKKKRFFFFLVGREGFEERKLPNCSKQDFHAEQVEDQILREPKQRNLAEDKIRGNQSLGTIYKASKVIDALVKTDSTNGASSPGCIVVGTIVYPFGSGSRTISHDISRELT